MRARGKGNRIGAEGGSRVDRVLELLTGALFWWIGAVMVTLLPLLGLAGGAARSSRAASTGFGV